MSEITESATCPECGRHWVFVRWDQPEEFVECFCGRRCSIGELAQQQQQRRKMYDDHMIAGEANQYAKAQHEGDAYGGEPYEYLAARLIEGMARGHHEGGWTPAQVERYLAHALHLTSSTKGEPNANTAK
jgi:hypothetical protein